MVKQHAVRLSGEERQRLHSLIRAGVASARTLARARVLLKADQSEGGPDWSDGEIATALEVGRATVERVRRRYAQEGLDAALTRRSSARTYLRKLDGRQEAHLVALVCGPPPEGRARWSLRLLAGRFVELGKVDAVSYETVRRTLKKTASSRGGSRSG